MKNQKIENNPINLVLNYENYMESLRENIGILRTHYGWSVRILAERSNISEDTLQTFLKGKSRDCNFSTVVKLSRAFGVSIDELAGAGTINPSTLEALSICRTLPHHSTYMISQFIQHQKKLYEKHKPEESIISVMNPPLENGRMVYTNVLSDLCVDPLPEFVKSVAYMGIRIPCDRYMPYYAPDEILLVGADREAMNGERCVVVNGGKLFIVTKQSYIENGVKKWRYVALMNNKIVIPQKSIDEKIGYVVGFLNPDGSWGIR